MTPEEIHKKIYLVPSEASFGIEGIKQICKWAEQLPKGISILEAGTAYGRSAFTWALATDGYITTYEPQDIQDIHRTFARKYGVENKMNFIRGDVLQDNGEYDVIWLDGNHEYEHVKKELKKFDKLVKILICGHDYGHLDFPGVKQAVDEFYGSKVEHHGIYWSIWK